MSMHIEWDTARYADVDVASAEEANGDWALDEKITSPFVLLLGGAGGGALAVEGTREELAQFAERVQRAVGEL